ncbi:putative TIR protein [Candidatus Sulfopaludibacter sp. SbA4]|nr:putative TIR protein [Candidatus Sulfopaludibacter sp. SbA4]
MGPAVSSFNDRNWRNLLMDMEAQQVIPVLGSELLVLGEEPGQPTLYQHLAKELVSRLSLEEGRLPEGYGLLEATNLFFQDPRNRADDLYYETRGILTERSWPAPEPLRQLAAITHFDLFVSTTFDSLLEQAVNEVRFSGAARTQAIAYAEKRQVEDIPAESGSARPTIFQLFGKLDATGDYGITEEKILEFTHRLQSRDLRPQNLFDALQAKSLLVLGCGFPGWLTRFLLRAAKGEQFLLQGSRGVIVDRSTRQDPEFALFLERRQTVIYSQGDAVQFVAELHRRWMEKFGPTSAAAASPQPAAEQPAEDFKPDSVFLSYASEDRQYALQVKQAFDQTGVDVWFDQSALESGDDYKLKIEKNIEDCSYFVPLISRNTATMEKRFFRREWSKAIDEAEAYPPEYPFIQPILLDDTPLDSPGIPRQFRERHVRKLEALPELIEDAKKRIRERRLQRRPA